MPSVPFEWGSWAGDVRVGTKITQSPENVTKDTARVNFRIQIWLGYRNGHAYNGTLTYSGYTSGSVNYRLDHPWGGAAADRLLVDVTVGYDLAYDKTVATSIYASTVVVWNGATPSKSMAFTIPRRPYHAPRPPKNQKAVRTNDTSSVVSWQTDYDSASGARPWTGVYVDRWSQSTNTWTRIATVTKESTSYTDKTTKANDRYMYRVSSYNSAGTSSTVSTGYIVNTPKVPNSVSATKDSSGNITVNWVNDANYQTGVKVYDNDVLVATLTSLVATWTHPTPNPTVTHQYKVRAVAGTLDSALSTPSNIVQLQAPPSAPTNLKFEDNTYSRENTKKPKITWKHNPVDSSEQTSYQLSYKKPGSPIWVNMTRMYTSVQEVTLNNFPEVPPTLGNWTWVIRTWGNDPNPSPASAEITVSVENSPMVAILTPPSGTTIVTNNTSLIWTYSQAQGRAQQKRLIRLIDDTAGGVEVWRDERATTATSFDIPYTLIDDRNYGLELTVYASNGLQTEPQTVAFLVDYLEPTPPVIDLEWYGEQGSIGVGVNNPSEGLEVIKNRVYRNINPYSDWQNLKNFDHFPEPVTNYAPLIKGSGSLVTIAKNYAPRIEPSGTWAEVRRNLQTRSRRSSTWGTASGVTITPINDPRFQADVVRRNGTAWITAGTFPAVEGETLVGSIRVAFPGASVDTLFNAFGGVSPPTGITRSGGIDHGDGTFTLWSARTFDASGTFNFNVFTSDGGDGAIFGDVMLERATEFMPFFDGSTTPETAEGVDQPADFHWRWLGTPNASESVMEIETVAGYSATNCIAGLSTRDGEPAIRLIPTSDSTTSYAQITIPAGPARAGGTAIGTLHIDEPLSGTLSNRRLQLYSIEPFAITTPSANVSGTTQHRLLYPERTSANVVRLYHGGAQGSGDVWWSDIQLYEGDYQGSWTGSEDLSMLDQPEDFTVVQESDGLALKGMGVKYYSVTGSGVLILSEVEGEPAIRVMSFRIYGLGQSHVTARISIPNVPELRSGGTLTGTSHIHDSLVAPGSPNTATLNVYNPNQDGQGGPRTEPGTYPQRLNYAALTSSYYARWYHGGETGSPDVWWSKLGLFAGDYDGPWFQGEGYFQDPYTGLYVVDTVTPEGYTHRTYQYPDVINSEWEYVGEIEPGGSLSDFEGLTNGKTVYRVDSITALGSSSRAFEVIEIKDPRAWLTHLDTKKTASVFYNIDREYGNEKVNSEIYDFDGRKDPVLIEGEANITTLAVSGSIDPTGVKGTTHRQFEEVAELAGIYVYRDSDGRRWYCRLSEVTQPIRSTKRRDISYTVTKLERPDNEISQ